MCPLTVGVEWGKRPQLRITARVASPDYKEKQRVICQDPWGKHHMPQCALLFCHIFRLFVGPSEQSGLHPSAPLDIRAPIPKRLSAP